MEEEKKRDLLLHHLQELNISTLALRICKPCGHQFLRIYADVNLKILTKELSPVLCSCQNNLGDLYRFDLGMEIGERTSAAMALAQVAAAGLVASWLLQWREEQKSGRSGGAG